MHKPTTPPGANGDIDPKIQAKLRKLLNLAERGVGGEKDNAQRMLEKLLARHGMTVDDLSDERREIRWFTIGNKYDRRLAAQIMAKICDTLEPDLYTNKQRPKQIGVKVTPAKAIEFEIHFDTLRKALTDHFQEAFAAFVQANRLYPSERSTDIEPSISERDLRVMAMASAIPPTQVAPRIEQQHGGRHD